MTGKSFGMGRGEVTRKLAKAATSDARWTAVVARDKAADGTFCYSVRTTGVYCRPSCGARLARPENVRFHATPEEAEQAGFRPCKRCRPNGLSLTERTVAKVAKACRLIERSDQVPSLDELAAHVGMSTFHLHRTFKAVTGLTPREYGVAHRSKRVRRTLGKSKSVSEAIYAAGFNSNSRFYEASNAMLGMTPTKFRSGGKEAVIQFAVGQCSLGSILVGQSERGVCAILLGKDPAQLVHDLEEQFPKAELMAATRGFGDVVAKVVSLIEEPDVEFELPLDIRGTAFQQRVWKALRQIPVGSTASYAEIAKRIGMPRAVRAVAQACGANSLAVAIPCHRVVRNDGALSGYRWGVERKRALLEREAKA
jgi:AraC family transcriptional regulator of adaptative response/methylated-DNA-[protein]-cysteine methyltransferase